MIRLTVPSINEDDFQAVHDVLASGFLVQGARVAAFEEAVASYVGCKYAVAVSSGTAALHLALLALDVRPDDLVLVTAYSWISTANVIELCGAQPVFVDIQPDTFNLDPVCLERELKRLMASPVTAKRVKAVLPVHTFGQLADMPAVLELSQRYGLPVVEDAACALGATLHDRQAGTWGAMGCFSLHPRKAITTGEGGLITTDNPALAKRLKSLRNHGLDPDAPSPDFIMPGLNYRMTELQAALGLTQMAKLDRIIADRCQQAAHYDALLLETTLQTPVVSAGNRAVYQSYVTLLPEGLSMHRHDLITRLKSQKIETTIGTWHMPMTTYFRTRYGYSPGVFPVTDRVFARSVALPIHAHLSEADQQNVCNTILHVVEELAR